MKITLLSLVFGFFMATAYSQQKRLPIIDMHLHSNYAKPNIVEAATKLKSMDSQQMLADSTFDYLKRYNIVRAVTDGNYALAYQKRDPERIIPARTGYNMFKGDSIDSLRKWFQNGTYKVMAEFSPQYNGLKPNDEELEKYFSLAEELDIPVGIHMGLGGPGAAYFGSPKYRMKDSNPLLLEDVLIKHPKLRIYIMHAGWQFLDELIGLFWAHPQVYVDVAVINWALPRAEFHQYLRRIVEAGYGNRVIYGSDEMQWPQSIKISVEYIQSATFLSEQQKEDIFYNNAAKFLRLTSQEIKKDKGD